MMPVYTPSGVFSPHYAESKHPMHDENTPQYAYQGGGFSFQKRNGRVDWKKLAAVDVEKISREIDVQTLQDNIVHVAFCDIDSELNLRETDASLRKLFRLAQLLIEYLLHSQEYLQGYIGQMETQIQKHIQNQTNLQTEMEKKSSSYRNLKKEYQKSKKLIAEYQLMLRAGASGFHKCSFCSKTFLNDEFLKAHILRRHADQNIHPGTPVLQRQFVNSTGPPNVTANNEELLKELGHITTKLQETEARMIAERDERDRKYEAERDFDFKRLEGFSKANIAEKDREIAELKQMVESNRDVFGKEINQLTRDKITMQKDLDLFRQNQVSKPSMLGNLQDVSSEERHEEELSKMKETLQKELTASYQEELRMLRMREDQIKKAHNEEIGMIKVKLAKYENALEKAEVERQEHAGYLEELDRFKQSMDEQTRKMVKWEEIMKTRKSKMVDDEEMMEELKLAQPVVFASTPVLKRSFEIPRDVPDADENLILHVASNSKNNFRVWRSSSPSQSEWNDLFNFKVSSMKRGQFNIPIYVFCASGSPYWRQYIASSPTPPRSSYKLDFVFYVSSVQLMGTTKLYVLQAGSGEVVKSMLSKGDIYPRWKPMGLSFYAMKGPSSQGPAKSVSFQSTLNESELDSDNPDSADEVSVSSFTGTEDAKKNLAAAIARSRTKPIDRKMEEELNSVRKDDSLIDGAEMKSNKEDAEDEEDKEEDEDVTFDETDGKLETIESTSQWGSTLLQTGSYLPFPENPLAIARYNHTKEMIDSCREVAIEVLNSNLERRGIDSTATGIKNEQFDSKMRLHENNLATKAKERPDQAAVRKSLIEKIDELARERLGVSAPEELKTPDKSKSKFKSAVNKLKNASIFGRTSPRKKEDAKHKLKDTSSRPNSFISESPSAKTPKLSQSNQSIEEVKPVPERKALFRQERETDENDEIFDSVSENIKWDSDESEDLSDYSPAPTSGSAQLPKVTVTQPGRSNNEPSVSGVSMRRPRGEKVRELTASLEASLRARQGIKKPAGAIDVYSSKNEEDDGSPGQRKQEKFDDDFDDDDDDFALSSLDEDDYHELARPKKEMDVTNTASPRPLPLSGSASRLPPEKTAISKFSADDDFDSDLDLGP